jgi:hypothetical protein
MIATDRSLRTRDEDRRMTIEHSPISKANVCPYWGREIPDWQALRLDPDRKYMLLRSPDELARGAATFSHIPVLLRHMPISADAPAQELVVGTTGEVTFEQPYLISTPLKIWTSKAIGLIESDQQRELSSAYRYRADMTSGQYEGVNFDGIMRDIRGNHVALVEEGRAGPDVFVKDQSPPEFSMKYPKAVAAIKARSPQLSDEEADTLAGLAYDAREKEGGEGEGEVEVEDEALTPAEKKAAEKEAKDAKLAKGMDAELDDEEKEKAWAKAKDKKAKDKKAKDKAAKDKAAKDKKAKDAANNSSTIGEVDDEQIDHRQDFDPAKGKDAMITKDEMRVALDEQAKVIRKQEQDLYVAREAVKPIVGVVAMDGTLDTADKVYAFALKHAGIKTEGVHPSAFPLLLDTVKSRRPATPVIAQDASNSEFNVSSIWGARAPRRA